MSSTDDDPSPSTTKRILDVAKRTQKELKRDNAPVAAAGIAFWCLLALTPALIAVVSIAGILIDPETIRQEIVDNASSMSESTQELLADQLEAIAGSNSAGLGITAAITIVVALWGASGAMKHLMASLNLAYSIEETRKFVKLRGVALVLTFGGILFVAVATFLLAVLPALLGGSTIGDAGRWTLNASRFPALAIFMVVALIVLYRWGPDRPSPQWREVIWGAVVATVFWILLSAIFSIYTSSFADFNETYAVLGAVVVLLLWLFITAFAVILGATVNSVLEGRDNQPVSPAIADEAEPADPAASADGDRHPADAIA